MSLTAVDASEIAEQLQIVADQVRGGFDKFLRLGRGSRLVEAMQYSLNAGGKRIRPALVLWSCEACGGDPSDALPAAVAVECVHTFSLIHDDLPALDDDDMRRGKPSNHKEFDEATAILAGDALFALAFEVLAREVSDPMIAAPMIAELASASGWNGMIGGEAEDLEGEAAPPGEALVSRIHGAKTARLMEACCRLGAMAAGADEPSINALARYGRALGMAFQASDDLLDVTGNSEKMGKKAGKDESLGKQTYPRAVGVEATRELVRQYVNMAGEAVYVLGNRARRLISLSRYIVERDN
jgi:geranylgeranyl diphosphate synthase type II